MLSIVIQGHHRIESTAVALHSLKLSAHIAPTDASTTHAAKASQPTRISTSGTGSTITYNIQNATYTIDPSQIYVTFYGMNAQGQWIYFEPDGSEESVAANYSTFPTWPTGAKQGTPYVPAYTLSQIMAEGGIKVPVNTVINSGTILIGLQQPAIALVSSNGAVVTTPSPSQSPDPNANSVYQLVEVTQNFPIPKKKAWFVNVDISEVDQFGTPMVIRVDPSDPTVPLGAGIGIPRSSVIQQFMAGATGNQAPFQLDVSLAGLTNDPYGSNTQVPPRIIAPKDVLALGPPTDQQQLKQYNALNTYFDQSINQFFATYTPSNPLTLYSNGGYVKYQGKLTQVLQKGTDGKLHYYYVMQFTGGSHQKYNVYYPFFSTNTPSSELSTTLYGAAKPPPPPIWWAANPPPQGSLDTTESPSDMVFACNGVFADNTFQYPSTYKGSPTVLANLENQIASALNRGVATSQVIKMGHIAQGSSSSDPQGRYFATMAVSDTKNLKVGMNILGPGTNGPLTVWAINPSKPKEITIMSLEPILPVNNQPMTFATYYAENGTWNYYAGFFHNPSVSMAGLAYGFPFDDQGGTSSDISTPPPPPDPSEVTLLIGPGHPQT